MYQAKQSKQTSYCNFVQLKKSACLDDTKKENVFSKVNPSEFSEEQKTQKSDFCIRDHP